MYHLRHTCQQWIFNKIYIYFKTVSTLKCIHKCPRSLHLFFLILFLRNIILLNNWLFKKNGLFCLKSFGRVLSMTYVDRAVLCLWVDSFFCWMIRSLRIVAFSCSSNKSLSLSAENYHTKNCVTANHEAYNMFEWKMMY